MSMILRFNQLHAGIEGFENRYYSGIKNPTSSVEKQSLAVKISMGEFLSKLKNTSTDEEILDFCRKSVLHGVPHIFQGDEGKYYEFRKRIAEKYDISFHEVYITGSAKLGFNPRKKTEFNYDSDIDVAIVSEELFGQIMEHIRVYQMNLRKPRISVSEGELKKYHKFLEYTAIGWMRPDHLPYSFQVKMLKAQWFQFFESLSYGKSEVGNYKVSAGVFRSYWHLEQYTLSGIMSLRTSLNIEGKNV